MEPKDEVKVDNEPNIDNAMESSGNLQKRLARNRCEKLRRDRIVSFLHLLECVVPMIPCGQKIDKCSILRLTVAYLKLQIGVKKFKVQQQPENWCPTFVSKEDISKLIKQAVDGFFMMVSQTGTILFVSDEITTVIGHHQFNLHGKSVYKVIHENDWPLFQSLFQSCTTDSISDVSAEQAYEPDQRTAYIRMLNLNLNNSIKAQYSLVHLKGIVHKVSFMMKLRSLEEPSEKWLVCICRHQCSQSIREISQLDSTKPEFISQHKMTGEVYYIDSRFSCLSGFLPLETEGRSVYQLVHKDDLEDVALSHKKIFEENHIPQTVFRLVRADGGHIFIQARSSITKNSWTHEPKYILSLNEVLEQEEGERKLKLQKQNRLSQIPPKMFTDDILNIMSEALTGSSSTSCTDGIYDEGNWSCNQFLGPQHSRVTSTPVSDSQNISPSSDDAPGTSLSTSCTGSQKNANTRKRPATDDPFAKFFENSLIDPDEENPAEHSSVFLKDLEASGPSQSPKKVISLGSFSGSSCKSSTSMFQNSVDCCSQDRVDGSMLKKLLTENQATVSTPGLKTAKVVNEKKSRSATTSQSSSPERQSPGPRALSGSGSPGTEDDMKMTNFKSLDKTLSNFVVSFTDQLKQKHALMQQSLLLQEATISLLETEVNKVRDLGHSSQTFQRICDRLISIKESKSKQQEELKSLQERLIHQRQLNMHIINNAVPNQQSIEKAEASQRTETQQGCLEQVVFPVSQSYSSFAQVDLKEIEPTLYIDETSECSKSTVDDMQFGRGPPPQDTMFCQSMRNINLTPTRLVSSSNTRPVHNRPVPSASQTASLHCPVSVNGMYLFQNLTKSPTDSFLSRQRLNESKDYFPNSKFQRSQFVSNSLSINRPCSSLSSLPSSSGQARACDSSSPSQETDEKLSSSSSSSSSCSSPLWYSNQSMSVKSSTTPSKQHDPLASEILDESVTLSVSERKKIIAQAYAKLPPHFVSMNSINMSRGQSSNTLYTA